MPLVGGAVVGARAEWGRLARTACAGTENIRRRPGRAVRQQCRAGARGEEVSAFRPPGRRPSGESPLTPAVLAG